MNTKHGGLNHAGMTGLLVALAMAGNVACAQQVEEPIAVRTDGLPPAVGARLTEKGKQGITALMQYVNRTRMIHGLDINGVAKAGDKRLAFQQSGQEIVAAAPTK